MLGSAPLGQQDVRQVRVGGLTLAVADRQPTFWDAVERGAWEPLTLATLHDLCRPGVVFLDCGAWVGPTTLLAAAHGAEVIAVEADPTALDQLRANLAANPDLARRVRIVPRALASGEGPVRMGARRKPGDSMSSLLLADAETHWTAEAVTPDALTGMIRPDAPLVVKIDIEGGEYGVVPAFGPLLGLAPTAVLLSLHPAFLSAAEGADRVGEATRRVLQAFAGWTAFSAQGSAWVPVPDPVAERSLERASTRASDWLFLRDWPSAV